MILPRLGSFFTGEKVTSGFNFSAVCGFRPTVSTNCSKEVKPPNSCLLATILLARIRPTAGMEAISSSLALFRSSFPVAAVSVSVPETGGVCVAAVCSSAAVGSVRAVCGRCPAGLVWAAFGRCPAGSVRSVWGRCPAVFPAPLMLPAQVASFGVVVVSGPVVLLGLPFLSAPACLPEEVCASA